MSNSKMTIDDKAHIRTAIQCYGNLISQPDTVSFGELARRIRGCSISRESAVLADTLERFGDRMIRRTLKGISYEQQ